MGDSRPLILLSATCTMGCKLLLLSVQIYSWLRCVTVYVEPSYVYCVATTATRTSVYNKCLFSLLQLGGECTVSRTLTHDLTQYPVTASGASPTKARPH